MEGGRATRGGGAKTVTKVKAKAASKKRKSKAKVGADDDSEVELDAEGNPMPPKKKGVFNKDWAVSEPLAALVGQSQVCRSTPHSRNVSNVLQISRPRAVKQIWEHIKANDLQVPDDKRMIICDEKMHAVFKVDRVHMFTMNKLLSKHFFPLEEGAETAVKSETEVKSEAEAKVKSEGDSEED